MTGETLSRRRRWYALYVLCFTLMMIGVDHQILTVALPTLVRELDASSSQLQWIVDSYILVFAGLLLTGGAIGDRFGRRGALQAGLVIFGTASVVAAFSSTAEQLIACRALMGVGAALAMPATLSILVNVFTDARERGRAIGVWSGVAAIGVALGPVIGGVLLDNFWWGSVFLVNVPVVLTALIAGHFLVPTSKDPSPHGLDPVGAVLSIVGLSTLLWTIIGAPERGWTSTTTLVAFGVAIAVLVGFVLWERHIDHPMLPMTFFKNPRFSAGSLVVTSAFFAMSGMLFLMTQYLQSVKGYDAFTAGVRLAPIPLTFMVAAPLTPRVVERIGTKRACTIGLSLASVGLIVLSQAGTDSSYLLVFVGIVTLAGGLALNMPAATESIMGSLPREKAGVGSAVNDTTRQTGGALGVAVLGSIAVSAYQSHLVGGDGVGDRTLEAAGRSIGSAVEAGTRLGGEAGDALIASARAAYTQGMHASLLVAAGVLAVGAFIAFRFLPAWAEKKREFTASELLLVDMVVDPEELASTPSGGST